MRPDNQKLMTSMFSQMVTRSLHLLKQRSNIKLCPKGFRETLSVNDDEAITVLKHVIGAFQLSADCSYDVRLVIIYLDCEIRYFSLNERESEVGEQEQTSQLFNVKSRKAASRAQNKFFHHPKTKTSRIHNALLRRVEGTSANLIQKNCLKFEPPPFEQMQRFIAENENQDLHWTLVIFYVAESYLDNPLTIFYQRTRKIESTTNKVLLVQDLRNKIQPAPRVTNCAAAQAAAAVFKRRQSTLALFKSADNLQPYRTPAMHQN